MIRFKILKFLTNKLLYFNQLKKDGVFDVNYDIVKLLYLYFENFIYWSDES